LSSGERGMIERRNVQQDSDPTAIGSWPAGTFPAPPPHRKAQLFSWRPSLAGILHLVAIWMIVVAAWCLAHDRLSPKSWRVPLSYSLDSLQTLTWLRAASELDYLPFSSRTNTRLGAPYHANWNDYPMYESVVTFLVGMVARWTDLITASNIAIIVSILASAASFYICCRLLRWRREWAAAGALLYAFTFYHTFRGLHHMLLSYDWTVPLAVMGVWLLTASKCIRLGDRVFWLCASSALFLGMGNPYNLSMWFQFLCLGLGSRFLLRRRLGDLVLGGVIIAVAALGFLAVNANTICYQMTHGENQEAVSRAYAQLETFALKPIELVLPPWPHRLVWLTDTSRKYATLASVKGEMFSPYLGVVGLVAVAWLAAEFGLRALNLRKIPRRLPSHVPFGLWVVFFSAVGGLNCFLGLFFGLMYFRASDRFSIFISAIALFFLVSRMSRLVRRWNRLASYAVASVVAGVGLLDQLPSPLWDDSGALAKVGNDQRFCQVLEEQLPPGAMIFQLPLMNFIDSGPILDCHSYEHVRPYLWSKHLRFSFGSVQGRTREDWMTQVAALPPDQAVKELERLGFAGLFLNRKAYEDRAEGMLRELAKCGKSQLIEDEARDLVCVVLNPSPHPAWPHSDDSAQIVYKRGWHGFTHGPQHWAGGNSLLYFMNDRPEGCDFHLTGTVGVFSARQVDIRFHGETIWSEQLEAKQTLPVDLRLHARPGRNYLYFKSDRKPEPLPGQPSGVRIAYGIVNLKIVKDPPTQP
jgi:hypothetical protein